MALTRTIAPTVEPVSLLEMKAHLRVDIADEDALITDLIQAAREHAEAMTGRQILEATYRLDLDNFPALGERSPYWDRALNIRPPRPPLRSVSSITYVATDGTTATVAASVYQVDTSSEPGRISLAYNQSWPSVRAGPPNIVKVTFRAGYATSAAGLPENVRALVKLIATDLFEYRGAKSTVQVQTNKTVDLLVWQLRIAEAA